MPTDVVIPKLGMTMKEGTIVEWAIADGARVERDQVVFVLSTDKLDTDVTAEASGTLHHRAGTRETHPVGTVVAVILAEGEMVGDGTGNGRSARVVSSPYARRLARERGIDLAGVRGTGPGARVVAADVTREPASAPATPAVAATPVARGLAEHLGVDLSRVAGTGPGGRITKADVRSAAPSPASAESIPLRGMRKLIAERMHASLQEMAQLTLGMEVDMTDAAALRKQLIREWERDAVSVSFTDLVGRAVVKALADHPDAQRQRRRRGHPAPSGRAPRGRGRGARRPARACRRRRGTAITARPRGGDSPPGFGVSGRYDRRRRPRWRHVHGHLPRLERHRFLHAGGQPAQRRHPRSRSPPRRRRMGR